MNSLAEADARLEGFADCEELVAAMLERMANHENKLAGEFFSQTRQARSRVLTEASLVVRLGQHRSAE